MLGIFKVVKTLESEIKRAKGDLDVAKRAESDRNNERRFHFLRQLYTENDNV